MLIATFIVFYRLLSFSQTLVPPRVLLGGLYALMSVVMVAQIITGESTVQQIVFTGMAYWLWHVCFKLIGNFEVEEVVRRKLRWMAISGIGMSVLTFLVSCFPISVDKLLMAPRKRSSLRDMHAGRLTSTLAMASEKREGELACLGQRCWNFMACKITPTSCSKILAE